MILQPWDSTPADRNLLRLMAQETQHRQPRLLNYLVDYNVGQESEYLFLVDHESLKHIILDAGDLPPDMLTSEPLLIPLLPPFPPGEWNQARISKDAATGQLVFQQITRRHFERITSLWHSVTIDFLELTCIARIRSNVHVVTHPIFASPVLFKYAPFPWEVRYLEAETKAYKLINSTGIGPKFLGHVTEGQQDVRTFGFLMEYIDDAVIAQVSDLAACQVALSKLHSRGLKHGDVTRGNFLMRGGKATLIDFETVAPADEEELKKEFDGLETTLKDPRFIDL